MDPVGARIESQVDYARRTQASRLRAAIRAGALDGLGTGNDSPRLRGAP